jgi:hypothetical protein
MVVLAATTAVTAGCSIEPDAPGQPTYEADVKPILEARCIRCHGSPPLMDPGGLLPTPTRRFDIFADTNCDTPDAGTACVHGAGSSAPAIALFLNLKQSAGGMPPPPAPALTSYQHDTILRWAAEKPPLEK